MAGLTHLVDSDAVIQALRGPGPALAQKLREHGGGLAVSAVTVTELTYGALRAPLRDDALDAVEEFLDSVVVLEIDRRAGRVAGAVRAELAALGTPIGPYDVLIAGQARAEGLILATGNVREFRRVKGLQVENWR
ncbi:MAG: vapC [Marmoricola sp.]|nr:vapC [Marmoricola sp.]